MVFRPESCFIRIAVCWVFQTETANEYVEPLIQEVYHEIDKLHQELVPMEELTMVRNYMLGEMCRNYESPFSLSDAWILLLLPVWMMIISPVPCRL